MSERGESSFRKLPGFAAKLYDLLTQGKAVQSQFREIAQDLVSRVGQLPSQGRLLDVGTGPGRLLLEIHQLNRGIQLHGLDVSASMVALAKKNLALAGIPADLRQGTINKTDYEDGFFDVVTCTGSFYLWNEPDRCLDELHRILGNGRSAYLYETYGDFNPDEVNGVKRAIKANLRDEGWLRRLLAPRFLEKQLRMTYRTSEYAAIIERTKFAQAQSYQFEKITLSGLPAFLRITLRKEMR